MTALARSYYADRTARTLELAARGPLTGAALARELGIDARTARRLLRRLAADGMLCACTGPARGYVPGPRLIRLACAVLSPAPVTLSARHPARPRTG
jgi:DNA-binding IclR family transcriptional regulator